METGGLLTAPDGGSVYIDPIVLGPQIICMGHHIL